MIKKTVTYMNLDDKNVTATFQFNLYQDELAMLNFLDDGSTMQDLLDKIGEANTSPRLVFELLKQIITTAVGRREGDHFIKDEKARLDLIATGAYSELLLGLMEEGEESVAKFVKGIMDRGMQKKIETVVTDEELTELTPEQMRAKIHALEAKNKNKTQ